MVSVADNSVSLNFKFNDPLNNLSTVSYPDVALDSFDRPCALEIVESAQADLASDEGTAQAHPIDPFTIAGPA